MIDNVYPTGTALLFPRAAGPNAHILLSKGEKAGGMGTLDILRVFRGAGDSRLACDCGEYVVYEEELRTVPFLI
jgi:hypothetical protein